MLCKLAADTTEYILYLIVIFVQLILEWELSILRQEIVLYLF